MRGKKEENGTNILSERAHKQVLTVKNGDALRFAECNCTAAKEHLPQCPFLPRAP